MDTELEKMRNKLPTGLRVRAARLSDVENAVALFNAYSIYTIGSPDYSVEELRNDWQSPGFVLAEDSQIVLTPQGKPVAYVDVVSYSEIPVSPYVWGCVHREYEGQGIGSYLMRWAEQRARKVLEIVPAGARVTYQTYTVSTHEPAKRLYAANGLQPFRHSFQMRIDMEGPPPKPQWPQGINLRAYQHPDELEAVYRVDNEAFSDHFGYVEDSFEEGFKRFRHHMTEKEGFDPELWFLAVEGEEIAGVALCRKHAWEDQNMGWVSSLAVLRPWRKRGIGLALLLHAFQAFYERGKRSVGLGVDAGNLTGALRLYENAGMYVERQYDRYEKELRPGVELSVVDLAD